MHVLRQKGLGCWVLRRKGLACGVDHNNILVAVQGLEIRAQGLRFKRDASPDL